MKWPDMDSDLGEGWLHQFPNSSSGCSACVWSLIDFVKLGVAERLNFFSLPRVDESVLDVLSAVQECHRYPITKLLRLLRTGSDWIRR